MAEQNEAKQMLELLRKIEWKGDRQHRICPYCNESFKYGHAKLCSLHIMIESLIRSIDNK